MEVKIGITDSPRELVFNSAQTPSEVETLVAAALANDADVLGLTDEKGRRFLVNSTKIAYVEIGAADSRRVGFGIGRRRAAPLRTGKRHVRQAAPGEQHGTVDGVVLADRPIGVQPVAGAIDAERDQSHRDHPRTVRVQTGVGC